MDEWMKALKEQLRRDPTEVYFTRNKSLIRNEYNLNVFFGLTLGKVFSPPISIMNGDLAKNLRIVVSRLCPPEPDIALFRLSTAVPITLIHDEKTFKVVYYVTRKDEAKLSTMLKNRLCGVEVGDSIGTQESVVDENETGDIKVEDNDESICQETIDVGQGESSGKLET